MSKDAPAPDSKGIANPELVNLTGGLLTLTASTPLPPGSRVAFDIPIRGRNEPLLLKGKVISVASLEEGKFRLTIRLHSLARDERSLLASAIGG